MSGGSGPAPAPVVAVVGTGEMGAALGRVLRAGGHRVVTCLAGRSARSAELAADAGVEGLPDFEALVREADVLLSVVPPAAALGLGARTAEALRATGATLLYADCNAVSPATAAAAGRTLAGAGAMFADAGIVGPPPRPGGPPTRLYASGPDLALLEGLAVPELAVRPLGREIGRASGLKMCYAALTKGLTALATELLVAGHAAGLSRPLLRELAESQPELLAWIERQAPAMPPKAHRWVAEMEEIAATFAAAGLTPAMLEGAADMYRLVAAGPLGVELPERRRRGRDLGELVSELVAQLAGNAEPEPAGPRPAAETAGGPPRRAGGGVRKPETR